MNDTPLIVISLIGFVLALCYSRSARGAKLFAQLYWSVIAFVLLVGTAAIALIRGDYTTVRRAVVLLLVVLTLTGVIPGLFLQLKGMLRGRRLRTPSENVPPSPAFSSTRDHSSLSQSEMASATSLRDAHRSVCPRCGHALLQRVCSHNRRQVDYRLVIVGFIKSGARLAPSSGEFVRYQKSACVSAT